MSILSIAALSACSPPQESKMPENQSVQKQTLKELSIAAPMAKKIPFTAEYHGKTISDHYNWLKDSGYPEVDDLAIIDYLNEENAYFNAFIEPKTPLIDTLFEEFKGRTNDEESSVPWIENGYEYKSFYKEGEEYRTYSRRKLDVTSNSTEQSGSSNEEVFLSVTALAQPFEYFTMGDWEISPNNQYLAYSYNTNGDERYKVVVKDLNTGKLLNGELNDTSGNIVFSADSQSLVYGLLDSDRWFTVSINLHQLGTSQLDDTAILTEADDRFFLNFSMTSSKEFLLIGSGQGETSEIFALPADDFSATPTLLVSREQAFLSSVDHANGNFYIVANDTHPNSRLVKVSDKNPLYENWETIIAGSDERYFIGMQVFKNFMSIVSRENGIERFTISDYVGNSHDVVFPESVFAVSNGNNPQFNQDFVRINYDSMVTPSTVFDYSIADKKLITKKVQKIPSGYDKTQYVSERIMAPARDGVLVPVTIVYNKNFKKDATHPMHLYAYGAYGSTVTPGFSTTRLSLLDRGFSYAIAHVRGSDMLGHQWYLDGKLKARNNTFNDFVDVARFLVSEKYVSAGNISISGRSAGGKLMGAVTIQAPQLWSSVTLGVPFVDVLNTMLDANLPLTPPEWSEWGNPIEDPAAFDLIQAYSPYDNIEARDYPPMLVTGGLNDPRVTYWEPAKWTARMRELKTDDNLLIMRINMGAGHFSNSGRYGRLRDYAEEFAFLLSSHGITE
ncbi:MAG: oligopeptidase B [Glaciecola sp.]|jgi:oligopeptidase B